MNANYLPLTSRECRSDIPLADKAKLMHEDVIRFDKNESYHQSQTSGAKPLPTSTFHTVQLFRAIGLRNDKPGVSSP
jgi:hypothetical protein